MSPPRPPVELSIVVPAHNEESSLEPLVEEIAAALGPVGVAYELIIVDDGSSDGTRAELQRLAAAHPELRSFALAGAAPGRPLGQSAAFHAGFRAARGTLVASLDADLQNDPADLPALLERRRDTRADVVQGDRSRCRRDGAVRRATSRVGRFFRRWLLDDSIRDTGCSLRVMRRDVALRLPLELRGMHRFVPVTARHLGYRVVEMEVRHRPRRAGRAKYGIWNRALPGLVDCLAVRWMAGRRRRVDYEPIVPDPNRRREPPASASAPTDTDIAEVSP